MTVNKRRLSGLVVTLLLQTSLVHAKTVEITPKNVPNWEYFTPHQLKFAQKEVDEGHQPWKTDPVSCAKVLLKIYYPEIDVNQMEEVPAQLKIRGKHALVKIRYKNKGHAIYLHEAFPSDPMSIWIAEKMVIE